MESTVYKERILLKNLIAESKQNSDNLIPAKSNLVDEDNYYFRSLCHKRFIQVAHYTHKDDAWIDGAPDSYCITDEGLHYFEQRREQLKQQLLSSVYLPIVVSFITTCITLALKHWLPRLLGWK